MSEICRQRKRLRSTSSGCSSSFHFFLSRHLPLFYADVVASIILHRLPRFEQHAKPPNWRWIVGRPRCKPSRFIAFLLRSQWGFAIRAVDIRFARRARASAVLAVVLKWPIRRAVHFCHGFLLFCCVGTFGGIVTGGLCWRRYLSIMITFRTTTLVMTRLSSSIILVY